MARREDRPVNNNATDIKEFPQQCQRNQVGNFANPWCAAGRSYRIDSSARSRIAETAGNNPPMKPIPSDSTRHQTMMW